MAVVEIGRDIFPMFSIKRRTTYLIEYMLKKNYASTEHVSFHC